MKEYIKRVIQLCMVAMMTISLVSCGKQADNNDPYKDMSKDDLKGIIYNLQDQVYSLQNEVNEKTTLLEGVQTNTDPSTGIQTMPDGTGRLTFNQFTDGTVLFPKALQFQGGTNGQTNGKISITDRVQIYPDSSWVVNINKSKVEFESPDLGISVQVAVGELTGDALKVDVIKDYMQTTFFADWPPDDITYRTVMCNGYQVGINAYTHTFIDSDDAYVYIGMLNRGTTSVCYTACYKGDESVTKNSAIENLLQSMQISTFNISIEN